MDTLVPSPDRSANLQTLQALAEGDLDLSVRLDEHGAGAGTAELLNQLLEKLGATLTQATLCGVNLYANVPQLFSLAEKLEAAALTQADNASHIARSAEQMAENVHDLTGGVDRAVGCTLQVGRIVAELEAGSRQIQEVLSLVQRIAAQTKLLSLNAAVEAARAGVQGRSFGVVAEEIKRLATEAGDATSRIGQVLTGIEAKIGEAVGAVGAKDSHGSHSSHSHGHENPTLTSLMEQMAARVVEQDREVGGVARDIAKIVEAAERQSEGATRLKSLAAKAREGSDALLVSLGVFRLPAHLKPRQLIAAIAGHEAIRSMQRPRQEAAMESVVKSHPYVELLYITDSHGTQTTRNVAAPGFTAAYGSSGQGKDWSARPWFLEPLNTGGLYTSDIYRSAASDRFCFTISAPIANDRGETLGVLGADIDLSQLL